MGVADLAVALEGHRRIAVDAMVFIYQFEDHPQYAPLTQLVFDGMEAGRLEAVASVLCLTEVLTGARIADRQDLVDRYRLVFATFPNLAVPDVTRAIADRAAELRARYRIRTPDAIHVATALTTGATALLSNDAALQRVTEVPVLALGSFV